MVTKSDGKNRLNIFLNFNVDHNLPKHKKKNYSSKIVTVTSNSDFIVQSAKEDPNVPNITWSQTRNGDDSADVEPPSNGFTMIPSQIIIGEGITGDPTRLSMHEMLQYEQRYWKRWAIRFQYVWFKVKSFFKRRRREEPVINYVALQNFFSRIPFQKVEQSKELVKYYEDALLHVEKTGQTALGEKLKNILQVVRCEISLLDKDMTKFVSEEQMTSLYEMVNASDKLKLTWIKNFVKIIPSDVLKLKETADGLEVFDNYVILHYDPKNDATNLTEQETRAKKDPIMFGVINNSNKLYYIADWVDEYCDMTLEKMFSTLGDQVLEINNESVKSFINAQR